MDEALKVEDLEHQQVPLKKGKSMTGRSTSNKPKMTGGKTNKTSRSEW